MTITVNGRDRPWSEGVTVGALVSELGRDSRAVAVAVNGEVVARRDWDVRELHDRDRVEMLDARAGG